MSAEEELVDESTESPRLPWLRLIDAEAGSLDRVYPIDGDIITIGRKADNDIVLNDPTASRKHARIARDGETLTIENLSKNNPVRINGQNTERSPIVHGDRIGMGTSELVLEFPQQSSEETASRNRPWIVVDAADKNILLSDIDEQSLRDLQRAKRNLSSLYRADQIISASLSTHELYDAALDIAMAEMPAIHRCSLHLFDPETEALECKTSRSRDSGSQPGEQQDFSRTLLDMVLHDRKAVLTYDAQGDDRFDSAQSIAALSIRSAMCVPIQVNDKLTGVIQVHSLDPCQFFDVHDLKLLTAFGMMAGVAIENARLYEELDAERERQEERAGVMQVMMHELKSPIGAVRMMVDVLLGKMVPEDKAPDFLKRIARRLDQMLAWIKDALDLSQAKAGDKLAEPRRLDLCDVVTEMAEEHREQAEGKGLAFELEGSDSPVELLTDERGLRLVISNLLSNAVKYTSSGSIRVCVASEPPNALLRVEDTGIGIPEKDVPKLFGEFFRASNARKSDIEGSGVGLASVKCIVERAGGSVAVDTREGGGTRFAVRIPLGPQSLEEEA